MDLEEAKRRKADFVRITAALDWQDRPEAGGYSINEMRAVFTKVQNKAGWKLPIRFLGKLTDEEVAIVKHAVPHFTGGTARIEHHEVTGLTAVEAAGYYACIGA